ncbi:hypothetical protein [Sphingomonas sp. PP-CC-1A-547]|nr:hypothetical protein [Sphingomonas sp. PP-CC-1A-547]RKE50295.1 hypothetical protein C8J39_1864 [Sphingomonas sp. PP-CC-1A-547]
MSDGVWVFFPLHDIGVFAAGFMTMFFIGLIVWIFTHDDGGSDGIL